MQQLRQIESGGQEEPGQQLFEEILGDKPMNSHESHYKQIEHDILENSNNFQGPQKENIQINLNHSMASNQQNSLTFASNQENLSLIQENLSNLQKSSEIQNHQSESFEKDNFKCTLETTFPPRKMKKHLLSPSAKKQIFKPKDVKAFTCKIPLAKYLVRMFVKYYQHTCQSEPTLLYNNNIIELLKSSKRNNFCMADVEMIFGQGAETFVKVGSLNRKLMWRILRQNFKSQIIFNRALGKNKRSYFVSTKVYELRCRSQALIKRSNFR